MLCFYLQGILEKSDQGLQQAESSWTNCQQGLQRKFLERHGCSLCWTCDGDDFALLIHQINTQKCGLDFLGVAPSAEAVCIIGTMKETTWWGEKSMNQTQGISNRRLSYQHPYPTPSHLLQSLTVRAGRSKQQYTFLSPGILSHDLAAQISSYQIRESVPLG